jgi:hypothetical protein
MSGQTTAAAEHAHPADRFAREILAILGRDTTRSRRLMRNPFNAVSFKSAIEWPHRCIYPAQQ